MEIRKALATLFPWVDETLCTNNVGTSLHAYASDAFFSFSDLVVGDDGDDEIHGAIVEGVSGWRSLRTGEYAAGLETPEVLVKFAQCDICGICIGAGYYEQSLYLFPIYGGYLQYLDRSDCVLKFDEFSVLKCCGGCAKHRSRMLPDWLCVLSPASWETTLLLCREGEVPTPVDRHDSQMMARIYDAAEEIIHTYSRYFFLTLLLSLNVSLAWFATAWREQQQHVLLERSKLFTTRLHSDLLALPMQIGMLPPLHYTHTQQSA